MGWNATGFIVFVSQSSARHRQTRFGSDCIRFPHRATQATRCIHDARCLYGCVSYLLRLSAARAERVSRESSEDYGRRTIGAVLFASPSDDSLLSDDAFSHAADDEHGGDEYDTNDVDENGDRSSFASEHEDRKASGKGGRDYKVSSSGLFQPRVVFGVSLGIAYSIARARNIAGLLVG